MELNREKQNVFNRFHKLNIKKEKNKIHARAHSEEKITDSHLI